MGERRETAEKGENDERSASRERRVEDVGKREKLEKRNGNERADTPEETEKVTRSVSQERRATTERQFHKSQSRGKDRSGSPRQTNRSKTNGRDRSVGYRRVRVRRWLGKREQPQS